MAKQSQARKAADWVYVLLERVEVLEAEVEQLKADAHRHPNQKK